MSTPTSRATLDRDRVIDAAIALADDAGLEATSMRRLADALGVTPMALYKHVASRDELIDGMVDRVVAGIAEPAAAGDWRDALRTRILAARAALRTHAWAQDAIASRTLASPVVLDYMDGLMQIMFDGGLSADLVHNGMHALSTRMWGFTLDVMPTPTPPADPVERERSVAAFLAAYPAIARMSVGAAHAGDGCDDDAEFAFALDLLIEGLQRRAIAERPR